MPSRLTSSIEFTLFAPNIDSVALTGSFFDGQEIPMKKFDDGPWYVNVNLEDGDYEYTFRLKPIVIRRRENEKKEIIKSDEFHDVIDPYATKVNLSKNVGIVTIKNGMKIIDEYQWKYDWEANKFPANKDLIIYELYIADFTEQGTFQAAVDKLDYLVSLGINCISLMPVAEDANEHDWGYAIRHFFCIRSFYGTSEDLKYFVDECHHRRIRVIFDAVCNHAQAECPLYQIDPTLYFYWNQIHHPEHPEEHWGPEFSYKTTETDEQTDDKKAAVKFMSDVLRYYIEEYHIDGLRFDAAKQIDDHKILRYSDRFAKEIIERKFNCKPFYTIAEFIPATDSITKPYGPLDSVWRNVSRPLVEQFQNEDIFDSKSLETLLRPIGIGLNEHYQTGERFITYLSSHDNDRMLRVFRGEDENKSLTDQMLWQQVKLAITLLYTATGVPMIYMGDEFGMANQTGKEDKTTKVNKLDWSLLTRQLNCSLFKLIQTLIRLRHHSAAIRTDNLRVFHADAQKRVLAYERWLSNNKDDRVVVVANFSGYEYKDYTLLNWPRTGLWEHVLREVHTEVSTPEFTLDLSAFDALVFMYKVV